MELFTKPMRTVHLLSRRIAERKGDFRTSVFTGTTDPSTPPSPSAAAGFLIGAGAHMDYRAAALIHSSSGEGAGLFFVFDPGFGAGIRSISK